MRARLTATLDRRLAHLLRARARRKSVVLRLLPDAWLHPLLAPSIRRLRCRLVLGTLTLSVLLAGVIAWFAVQAS